MDIQWKDSGGCSDGNNLSSIGIPVIDTLGLRGEGLHTFQEYIIIDSILEQIHLNTTLIQDLASGGLEEIQA